MTLLGTPHSASIGTWVKIASPTSFDIVTGAGFDFVVLDLEHGLVPLQWVHEACVIAQARGLAVLVRQHNASGQEVSRVLDMGADGILVPQLRSAEQTRTAVEAALFPPRGTRGAGPTTRAAGWGLTPRSEYLARETVQCIQFETAESFDHLSHILDVDGVNAALLGRVDLAVSLGVPDADPRLDELAQLLLAETSRRNIPCGTAVDSPNAARAAIDDGFSFVVIGNDATELARAMAALTAVDTARRTPSAAASGSGPNA